MDEQEQEQGQGFKHDDIVFLKTGGQPMIVSGNQVGDTIWVKWRDEKGESCFQCIGADMVARVGDVKCNPAHQMFRDSLILPSKPWNEAPSIAAKFIPTEISGQQVVIELTGEDRIRINMPHRESVSFDVARKMCREVKEMIRRVKVEKVKMAERLEEPVDPEEYGDYGDILNG